MERSEKVSLVGESDASGSRGAGRRSGATGGGSATDTRSEGGWEDDRQLSSCLRTPRLHKTGDEDEAQVTVIFFLCDRI